MQQTGSGGRWKVGATSRLAQRETFAAGSSEDFD